MNSKLILALLALCGACALAASVLAMPKLRPETPLSTALLLLLAGFVALKLPRQAPGWGFLWVVLAALVLIPFAIVARGFGRVDMMAFLFHAQLGIDGGSILTMKNEIVSALAATLIFLIGSWYLLSVLWPLGRPARLALPAVIAVLVGINPLSAHILRSAVSPAPDLQLAKSLVEPVVAATPDPLPDLVYVYLEGLDRRFTDPVLGGDSYAPLHELAARGLSFNNVAQINGTGWSLAGMVASHCGVPLLPRGLLDLQNLKAVTNFMPDQTCLGDILDGFGYSQEFIVGGDAEFAGINAFYASHGVEEIWGLLRQALLHPKEDAVNAYLGWVIDDQIVYDTARLRLGALTTAEAPFALYVETIGPHGVKGYLSRRCTEGGKAELSYDHIRVVRCLTDLT